ncbi:DivIVA domain-containing protein [Micromonospora carbonacea]|uniref:DivIVA domain-containing protein n=1 Tax=Micromonospora carbonacea TaxID=47853 RepID=UPI00341140E5
MATGGFGAAPGPRPSAYVPMQPWQVRTQRFRAARFGRRGLDPGEVRAFLDRLATELTAQHEALRAARWRRRGSAARCAACGPSAPADPTRADADGGPGAVRHPPARARRRPGRRGAPRPGGGPLGGGALLR